MHIENSSGINETLIEIGKRIKDLRIASCYTQKDLAKCAGISVSSIYRIEQGQSIQFDNLLAIMKTLNMLSKLELIFPEYKITPTEQLKKQRKKKIYRPKKVNLTRKRNSEDGGGDVKDKILWDWGE